MPYKIEISPAAQRDLKSVPSIQRDILARAIYALGSEPRPAGVRKIKGLDNAWRLRVREFRVVYEVYDDRRLVVIFKVDRRRERTYRRL